MKLSLVLGVLLLSMCVAANATDHNKKPPPSSKPTTSSSTSKATSSSKSGSKATAEATGGAGGSVGDVSTGSITNEVHNPDDIKIKNVPDVFPPNASPTAPCMGAWSVGVGVVGAGIGGGSSKLDPGCDFRATAREFFLSGDNDGGRLILCHAPAAVASFGTVEKCVEAGVKTEKDKATQDAKTSSTSVVAPPDVAPACTVPNTTNCFTPEELKERDRRMLEHSTGK